MRFRLIAFVCLTVLVAHAATASAQLFGQWSWDASVTGDYQQFENSSENQSFTSSQNNVTLDLGLNGFVFNPAFAKFRLDIQTVVSNYDAVASRSQNKLGGGLDIEFLRTSTIPFHIFFKKHRFDYSEIDAGHSTLYLGRLPSSSMSVGATAKVKRGIARGLQFGMIRSNLDFKNDATKQVQNWQYIDFARAGSQLVKHFRVERHDRNYGSYGYSTDHTTFSADLHGPLAPNWRWDFSATEQHRISEFGANNDHTSDVARLNSRFSHNTASGALQQFSYSFGYASGSRAWTTTSHRIAGEHLWRLDNNWSIGPSVDVIMSKQDGFQTISPGAGFVASWSGIIGPQIDTTINGRARIFRREIENQIVDSANTGQSYSFNSAFARGNADRLRTELEISVDHSVNREVGQAYEELPDLGVEIDRSGTENGARARITFTRSFSQLNSEFYSEVRISSIDDDFSDTTIDIDSLRNSIRLNWRQLNFTANQGSFSVTNGIVQENSYYSSSLSWNPWAPLTLSATYLVNTQQVRFAPDLDSTQVQANISLAVGKLSVSGQYFETTGQSAGARTLENRTIMLRISRRFDGWLPIISAPQRRGFIR